MVNNENIHIIKDENNLIVIDPNKVIVDGKVNDRYLNQENLQMFANLEVDVKPRSAVTYGDRNNEGNLRQMVAKGMVNFMGPNGGDPLNISWVDDFVGGLNDKRVKLNENGKPLKTTLNSGYEDYVFNYENEYDTQLLGIKDIEVETKPTNLATSVVKIRMVDIRGRALMEKTNDSIYSVFFNLPYPTFYLTLKGYVGESITYQLVIKSDVKIEFDADGDYYLIAEFLTVGQKLLNDIPLRLVDRITEVGNENIIDKNGVTTTDSATRNRLKEIYSRYLRDGYIDQEVYEQNLNITEMVKKIKTLNEVIDKQIIPVVDISFFDELTRFQENIQSLLGGVSEWVSTYTISENPQNIDGAEKVYNVKTNLTPAFEAFNPNNQMSIVFLVDTYLTRLRSNPYLGLGNNVKQRIILNYGDETKKLEFKNISSLSLLSPEDLIYSRKNLQIRLDKFEEKMDKIMTEYESVMVTIKETISDFLLSSQTERLGFKPTLKNVMGIILANIETFLTVLDDTHQKTINLNNSAKQKRLKGLNIAGDEIINTGEIFPFPVIHKMNEEQKVVETYPADPDIVLQASGFDMTVWPEVKMVRDYVSAYLEDKQIDSDVNVVTNQNKKFLLFNDIVNFDRLYNETTYIDLLYRIFNRSLYVASVYNIPTRFMNTITPTMNGVNLLETIRKLGKLDSQNIIESINSLLNNKELFKRNDVTLNTLLTSDDYLKVDFNRYADALDFNFINTKNNQNIEGDSLYHLGITILDNIETTNFVNEMQGVNDKLLEFYKKTTTNLHLYPFSSEQYKNRLNNRNNFYRCGSNLQFNKENGQPQTTSDYDIIKLDFDININGVLYNPLNHRLFSDEFYPAEELNKTRGYVFLNSLKMRNLYDVVDNNSFYFSGFINNNMINVKLLQALRWGSIWYRYKKYVNEQKDILNPFFTDNDFLIGVYENDEFLLEGVTDLFQTRDNIDPLNQLFVFNPEKNIGVDVGFYPHIIVNNINKTLGTNYTLSDLKDLYYIDDNNKIEINSLGFEQINGITIRKWNTKVFINGDQITIPTYVEPLEKETTITQIINNSFIVDNKTAANIEYGKLQNNPLNEVHYARYFIDTTQDITLNGGDISDLLSIFDYKTLDVFEDLFVSFTQKDYVVSRDTLNLEKLFNESLILSNDQNFVRNVTNVLLSEKDKKITFIKNNPHDIFLPTLYKLTKIGFSEKYEDIINDDEFEKNIELLWGIPKQNTSDFIRAKSFFNVFNIKYEKEEMHLFRGVIRRWLTFTDDNDFLTYLTQFTDDILERATIFISGLFDKLNTELSLDYIAENSVSKEPIVQNLEIEKKLYRLLKNISDTWVGAWDFKHITLPSMFKYVDQINRPIGDKFYVDVNSLTWYFNNRNIENISIGQFISSFLKHNNLSEPISLGSSIDFYNENNQVVGNNDERIRDAQKIANNIFGIHTEVKKNGAPKFIIFQRSHQSEILKLDRTKYKIKTDGFSLSEPNVLMDVETTDHQRKFGNRSVSFYVDFGVQNQNMFKEFSISSYDGVKTQEELKILEDIGSRNRGSSTSTIGSGLLDILKVRTYSCKIKMIGNVTIQPFMLFELRYIPLFSGTYLILSVKHSMSSENGIMTEFEGVRVSKFGTGSLNQYLVKTKYKLLDNLIETTKKRVNKKRPLQVDLIDPDSIRPNLVKLSERTQNKISIETLLENNSNFIDIVYNEYGINTREEIAHFLAQTHYESDGFKSTVEKLNYTTVEQIRKVWPGRFKDLSDNDIINNYVGNPESLANFVYNNRLGNTEPNDGFKYRGRGYIQLTGKNNYKSFQQYLYNMYGNKYGDNNIVDNPDLVSNQLALESAAWFWVTRNIKSIVKRYGIDVMATRQITKLIRGSENTYIKRHELFGDYYDGLNKI